MKGGDGVVGWCNKYHARIKGYKAEGKCIPLGCLYYRSYGAYPRRLKVPIKDLVENGGERKQ